MSETGYIVQILDVSVAAFDLLPTGLIEDGQIVPIIGDGTLESDLRKASAQDADVLIAVSGKDAANAMSAQIAHHILGVPRVHLQAERSRLGRDIQRPGSDHRFPNGTRQRPDTQRREWIGDHVCVDCGRGQRGHGHRPVAA